MKLTTPDMPKLESPFVRESVGGQYVCIPKIRDEYRWVFEDGIAVDKLDGTNVSVWIVNGKIKAVYNRLNEVDLWTGDKKIIDGVREAVSRGYIKPSVMADGGYYGECIGDKIQGNPYKLEGTLWLPFEKAKEKYTVRYWQEMLEEFNGKSDEEIYNIVSDFFKGLWSLYALSLGIKGEVDENTVFPNNGCAEGLVFYSKSGEMAKLRRDMFNWYKGTRH